MGMGPVQQRMLYQNYRNGKNITQAELLGNPDLLYAAQKDGLDVNDPATLAWFNSAEGRQHYNDFENVLQQQRSNISGVEAAAMLGMVTGGGLAAFGPAAGVTAATEAGTVGASGLGAVEGAGLGTAAAETGVTSVATLAPVTVTGSTAAGGLAAAAGLGAGVASLPEVTATGSNTGTADTVKATGGPALDAAAGGAAVGGALSGIDWGNLKDLAGLGSALYGVYQGIQQQNMAEDALKASDPFGPYRAGYAERLDALMKDPNSITSDPGYIFQRDQGEQGLVRQMAAMGNLGSGGLGVALSKYNQDYASTAYNTKVNQLAGLAGAGISPNAGPALSGNNLGIETMSSSLGQLGYSLGHSDFSWLRNVFGTDKQEGG